MRDQRFVAKHRGGSLCKEDHRALMRWARGCSEHVLPLIPGPIDLRLILALETAKAWEAGDTSVGEARKASVAAHAAARASEDPIVTAVSRSIGHTVATAHMADHALGGALYALKALKAAGKALDSEKAWQRSQLKLHVPLLVSWIEPLLSSKERSFKL